MIKIVPKGLARIGFHDRTKFIVNHNILFYSAGLGKLDRLYPSKTSSGTVSEVLISPIFLIFVRLYPLKNVSSLTRTCLVKLFLILGHINEAPLSNTLPLLSSSIGFPEAKSTAHYNVILDRLGVTS